MGNPSFESVCGVVGVAGERVVVVGSNKANSRVTSACAPIKKINAIVGCDNIFHTRGNPIHIVANRRGRSDQRDFLGELMLPLVVVAEVVDVCITVLRFL